MWLLRSQVTTLSARLPRDARDKTNLIERSWHFGFTQEIGLGQISVSLDRNIQPWAAHTPNSQASLPMQTTILKNKRGFQAEKEITNKDNSTTITKK